MVGGIISDIAPESEGFMIRLLETDEIKNIYNTHIKRHFPRNERRPLYLLRKLFDNGRYLCLVYEEENQVIAYATFIHDDAMSSVLLDYFAVDEGRRGCGIGDKLISFAREYWRDKAGIIIECETPDSAKNEDAWDLRKRRIDFYLRTGAEKSPARWRLFGVDYAVLWIPTSPKHSQPDVTFDLASLYSLSLPASLRHLFIRYVIRADRKTLNKHRSPDKNSDV